MSDAQAEPRLLIPALKPFYEWAIPLYWPVHSCQSRLVVPGIIAPEPPGVVIELPDPPVLSPDPVHAVTIPAVTVITVMVVKRADRRAVDMHTILPHAPHILRHP